MNYKLMFVAALLLTFILTVLISRKLIPVLKGRKMGQKILEIGPRWHKSKEGTPTMGGLAFITAVAAVGIGGGIYLSVTDGLSVTAPLILTILLGVFGGFIGCVDDAAKLKNKRNEGLTPPQKFLLQIVAAALYLVGMAYLCGGSTELYIPYADVNVDLGIGYYIIAMFLITGMMNSVNLTDGIDGLSSGVTLVVGAFFAAAGFITGIADGPLILLGALIIGATAGFLVYNAHPARVFMGDTGSLFLGGLVVGGAFMMRNPLLVLVFGFVYVVETASVILQVLYFKLTHGKRLFKMSPIHHHFERCGWSENKIVIVFSVVAALFCALALLGIKG